MDPLDSENKIIESEVKMNDEEYIKIFNQDNMPMSEPGSSTSSDR